MILLFAVNIALICNTELTLQHNKWLETDGSENEWSFGQVLAILLLLVPLRDLRIFGARRDFTSALQNAVRWHASTDVLRDLVRRGAHVNVRAEGKFYFPSACSYTKGIWPGSTYPTVLHLAVADRRDAELTRMLLVYGADPNIKDGTDRTPLQAASLHGDLPIARLLLAHGADPNIKGGEYSTALQAASHAGHLQIVQLLLESGADVNTPGQKYRSALEAASNSGHMEIVELLREHGEAPD
ncbi:ankyrin repeat-containing domain protein [Mycena albidolilacea]|uniref:Ankyrin repeat-containing domain protein n=1 Tax=Mycena albidolilacea TaxID=1033008 RepID=A0AAD7EF50_9AGAR|nr:ankyrin repeat-containing domain protein [Mycena albidolilacea]